MTKKLLIITTLALSLMLCSCSVVGKLLDKVGLGDLNEKLEQAWEDIGKDVIAEMTDDMWREFGFGKNIKWPEEGVGAKLPKLRDGEVVVCYSNEQGGYIKAVDVTKAAFGEYKQKFNELGFVTQLNKSSFSAILYFDGLYVGFSHESETLIICYADTEELLDDIKNGGFATVTATT